MNLRLCLVLILCVLGFHPAHAAIPGLKPDGHLDMALLRNAYFDGDFGKVRAALDGFLKKHPKDVLRDEKIFTHLHLGIFCAADSNSQARAERHFLALLQLAPDIGIGDLLVPQRTQDLFERVRRNYFERKANQEPPAAGSIAPLANGSPDASPSPASATVAASAFTAAFPAAGAAPAGAGTTAERGNAPEEFEAIPGPKGTQDTALNEGGHAWVWWTVGSAAVAAAGMGVYALVAIEAPPEAHRALADGTLK